MDSWCEALSSIGYSGYHSANLERCFKIHIFSLKTEMGSSPCGDGAKHSGDFRAFVYYRYVCVPEIKFPKVDVGRREDNNLLRRHLSIIFDVCKLFIIWMIVCSQEFELC